LTKIGNDKVHVGGHPKMVWNFATCLWRDLACALAEGTAKFCIFGAFSLVRFYYITSYTKLSILMFDFQIAETFGHTKEMNWGVG